MCTISVHPEFSWHWFIYFCINNLCFYLSFTEFFDGMTKNRTSLLSVSYSLLGTQRRLSTMFILLQYGCPAGLSNINCSWYWTSLLVTVNWASERCNEWQMNLMSLAENCPRRIFIQTVYGMWSCVTWWWIFRFYKKWEMCLLSDLASQECFCFMELIVHHVGRLGSRFVWFHKRFADIGRQVSLQDFFLHINASAFILLFWNFVSFVPFIVRPRLVSYSR